MYTAKDRPTGLHSNSSLSWHVNQTELVRQTKLIFLGVKTIRKYFHENLATLSGFINKTGAYTLRRQILLSLSVHSLVTGIFVLLHTFVF